MATANLQAQARSLIDEINDLAKSNNNILMCNTIKRFTELLYSNQYLIYSNINEYFDGIGLTYILMDSLMSLSDQSRRDILRLLHLFIKTNRHLRNQARLSDNFMKYLSDTLTKEETWNNTKNYKYHIHIAAHIIIDPKYENTFNTIEIRKLVRQKIDQMMFSDNKLIYIVYYACAMNLSGFESIIKTTEDANADSIVSKDIMGMFIEMIRDYRDDFKSFYKTIENDSNKYILYRLKSEFSFDQICRTIVYFAIQSEKLRMNIFESGLYELMSNLFTIENVPQEFMLLVIDILRIPSLDSNIKQKFLTGYQRIFDRLLNFLRNESVCIDIKNSIVGLMDLYHIPRSSLLITLPSANSNKDFNKDSNFCSIDRWGSLDVDNWLAENNLEELRTKFTNLTGRGLKQMKKMIKETNGKSLLIDMLSNKLNINMVLIFEFMGALECLE